MITTVTTTTVLSAAAIGTGLGVAAVIALIILLIAKELSTAELEGGVNNEKLRNLASILTIPIASLMLVFMVIVATKIWEVL
ncbi:MAG: hypothetical protein LN415_09260 [Candidatus Thermoplasmatota archaeon]|nr:hypothetical protein [Candidatus Thermoplasmatota archaeon]